MQKTDLEEWGHLQNPLMSLPNILSLIFLSLTVFIALLLLFYNQIAARAALRISEDETNGGKSVLQRLLTLEMKEERAKAREERLTALEADLRDRMDRAESLLAVRSQIAADLGLAFQDSGLDMELDVDTGTIRFFESAFFDPGQNVLLDRGREILDIFFPRFASVLLKEAYIPYLSEIIVEGHTYDMGNPLDNLALSHRRALSVASHLIAQEADYQGGDRLKYLLTVKGRSYSDPIIENGQVSQDLSRRVEFRFLLNDEAMLIEFHRLLKGESLGE